jgi:hypothetical protein
MTHTLRDAVWALDLKPTEKFILVRLADMANEKNGGGCWPSIARLAKDTGFKDRAIRGALKSLARDGHLTIDERPGKAAIYYPHPGSKCRTTPAANAEPPAANAALPRQQMPPNPYRTSKEPDRRHRPDDPAGGPGRIRAQIAELEPIVAEHPSSYVREATERLIRSKRAALADLEAA